LQIPPDNWQVNPEEFENVFTVTAKLIAPDDIEIDSTITIAAFIDGECRGIQNLVYSNDEWLLFLMVYGNNLDQEIHFYYHVNALDSVFDIEEIITFTPGGSVGTPDDPILFHDSNLEISDHTFLSPGKISLSPAYPNPFNPTTKIRFSAGKTGMHSLQIYDINGRLVEKLIDNQLNHGVYEIVWNASNHPSGVYFIQLVSGYNIQTEKVLLIK